MLEMHQVTWHDGQDHENLDQGESTNWRMQQHDVRESMVSWEENSVGCVWSGWSLEASSFPKPFES